MREEGQSPPSGYHPCLEGGPGNICGTPDIGAGQDCRLTSGTRVGGIIPSTVLTTQVWRGGLFFEVRLALAPSGLKEYTRPSRHLSSRQRRGRYEGTPGIATVSIDTSAIWIINSQVARKLTRLGGVSINDLPQDMCGSFAGADIHRLPIGAGDVLGQSYAQNQPQT